MPFLLISIMLHGFTDKLVLAIASQYYGYLLRDCVLQCTDRYNWQHGAQCMLCAVGSRGVVKIFGASLPFLYFL